MLLQNLSKMLDDPRRRNIILVTLLSLLTMLLVSSLRLLHQFRYKSFTGTSKIESMQSIQSIPGGLKKMPPTTYTQLQIEQNKRLAEKAKKTGGSAIATIVDGFEVKQPLAENASQYAGHNSYLPPSTLPEADYAMANHQAFMSQQQIELSKQQLQGAMQQQMAQLFSAWSHVPSQVQVNCADPDAFKNNQAKNNDTGSLLVKAGTILNALLLTEINSDEKTTPVLAKVTTGKFKDACLIGNVSLVGERLLIQFHTLQLSQHRQSVSVQALAIDETTAKTSLASHVDKHRLSRYGSLLGSFILQNVGIALQWGKRDEQSFNYVPLLLSTTGNMGSHVASELTQYIHQPPTVCVHAGTSIGILFSADVIDPFFSKT